MKKGIFVLLFLLVICLSSCGSPKFLEDSYYSSSLPEVESFGRYENLKVGNYRVYIPNGDWVCTLHLDIPIFFFEDDDAIYVSKHIDEALACAGPLAIKEDGYYHTISEAHKLGYITTEDILDASWPFLVYETMKPFDDFEFDEIQFVYKGKVYSFIETDNVYKEVMKDGSSYRSMFMYSFNVDKGERLGEIRFIHDNEKQYTYTVYENGIYDENNDAFQRLELSEMHLQFRLNVEGFYE